MKRIIFCFLAVFLAVLAQAQGIQFSDHKSWKDALAQAKAENRLIFLDAYTTWCGPCKYMQKTVFPQAPVGKFYNANFINVKIDLDKGEGPELARQLRLTSVPTLLFMDGEGRVVLRFEGALDARKLVALGKAALNSDKKASAMK